MKEGQGRKRQKKEAHAKGDGRASFQEVLFVLF